MRFSPIKATGTTSRRPFCPAFSKAGEKFPEGNAQKADLPPENACKASGIHALCVQVGGGASTPRQMPRSGLRETVFAVS